MSQESCICGHPEDWHVKGGRCQAGNLAAGWRCSCFKFRVGILDPVTAFDRKCAAIRALHDIEPITWRVQ